MKKCLKKVISSVLAASMLFSSFTVSNVFAAPSFSKIGGWNETIYAEISGLSDSAVTGVSYSGTMSGSLTGDDLTYLVRDKSGSVRIDIPGLKPGDYTLNVETTSGTATQTVTVPEQDRSGFAHYTPEGGAKSYAVGAYNLDGTLKANAKVLYVTNENKDTVSVTSSDGTTVTGIGNILNSAGKDSGTGTTSKGGVPNTNQGIIGKLADDGTPLVVRLVGDVKAPAGVTAYDSVDYGGTVGDNGYMARMQGGKDITIEGIGSDAGINGWGIHFICDTAGYAKGNGQSFEVRNVKFTNVPEDCIGMEGQQQDSPAVLLAPVEHVWIHNCEFYAPSISNPAESDKAGGDGACDFKRGQYFTNSYCYYEGYHKTNLVGSSDSSMQYHLTYHHNYWKKCEARGPLARQADIHMYNNFFEGQSDYAMNTRANAYIFSEYNLFYMCKNPMRVDAGAIKSYNDSLSGYINEMGGTVVTDKSTKVSSGCAYENFDTDSSISYIPSGDYDLQESVTDARKVITAYTGTMKESPITPEEANVSMIASDRQPTASVQLPYNHKLNNSYITSTTGTVDNVIFNVGKTDASALTTATTTSGQDIVFNVNQAVNISMVDGGGTYPVILLNASGEEIITGTGSATNVPAGTYFIQSSGFQPGKSGAAAKFKEAKISELNIVSAGSELPTVAEPTTSEPTTADPSQPTEVTTSSGGDTPTEETTSAPYEGEGLVWNYTDKTNTLNATVDCNDWASATPVTYNGTTFTSAVKMESSSNITFNAPGSGNLTLVTYSSKNPATIVVNGETVTVSQNGGTTIPVNAGTVTITKGTASTYLYLMEFVGASTETTTVEATTQATTSAVETTTVKADTTTETTTTETPDPSEGVKVSVGTNTVKVGEKITVPVKLTGMTTLGNYDMTVTYDKTLLQVDEVVPFRTSDNFIVNTNTDGIINVVYANELAGDDEFTGDVLFNITFTALAEGTSNIAVTVNELFGTSDTPVDYTVENGSVAVTKDTTPTSTPGDVNKDGKVDSVDAAIVLKIASGIITDTTPYDMVAADCDGQTGVTVLDSVWILNHQTGTEETTEATTAKVTEATTAKATEATTEATTKADATTEATTSAPAEGNVYTHNFDDGTSSSYYTISGNTSTSKGSVTYNGLTINQCLKMESSTAISFTAAKAGKLTLVFGGSTAPAGLAVKVDGTSYTVGSDGTVTVDLAAGAHAISKGDAIFLFYMSYAEDGASVPEVSTEATTSKTETTTKTSTDESTEATTANLDGAINIPAGDGAAVVTALESAVAGDVINLAPGEYSLADTIKMSQSATATAPITVTCASGMATLNFNDKSGNSGRGITVSGKYINFSNINVYNSKDNGMYVTGGYVNVENCIFQANGDTGLQISQGGNNVLVKNCTSFDNLQTENADGFAAKLGAGENVVFDGCIAYCNSDDGWDLFSKSGSEQNKYPITLRNCIAFKNGTLTDGTVEASGDRNGFKLGGGGYGAKHIVENCIAFENGACGFTDNNNPDLAELKNCTGYKNATSDVKKHNFSIYRATTGINVTNCLSYVLNADPTGDGKDRFDGTSSGTAYSANATVANSVFGCTNKYYKITDSANITATSQLATAGTEVTISDSDFESLTVPYTDITKVHEQMRNADGSIKLNGFLQPKAGTAIAGMGAQFN